MSASMYEPIAVLPPTANRQQQHHHHHQQQQQQGMPNRVFAPANHVHGFPSPPLASPYAAPPMPATPAGASVGFPFPPSHPASAPFLLPAGFTMLPDGTPAPGGADNNASFMGLSLGEANPLFAHNGPVLGFHQDGRAAKRVRVHTEPELMPQQQAFAFSTPVSDMGTPSSWLGSPAASQPPSTPDEHLPILANAFAPSPVGPASLQQFVAAAAAGGVQLDDLFMFGQHPHATQATPSASASPVYVPQEIMSPPPHTAGLLASSSPLIPQGGYPAELNAANALFSPMPMLHHHQHHQQQQQQCSLAAVAAHHHQIPASPAATSPSGSPPLVSDLVGGAPAPAARVMHEQFAMAAMELRPQGQTAAAAPAVVATAPAPRNLKRKKSVVSLVAVKTSPSPTPLAPIAPSPHRSSPTRLAVKPPSPVPATAAVMPAAEADEDKARQQNLRFDGDLYTPRWVRLSGAHKEGLCELCPAPGKWLQLKNSAFWYHKQFLHGISSVSGVPFTAPMELRVVFLYVPLNTGDEQEKATAGAAMQLAADAPATPPPSPVVTLVVEGRCHECREWHGLMGTKRRCAIPLASLLPAHLADLAAADPAAAAAALPTDPFPSCIERLPDAPAGSIKLLAPRHPVTSTVLLPTRAALEWASATAAAAPAGGDLAVERHHHHLPTSAAQDVKGVYECAGMTVMWFRHAHKCHVYEKPKMVRGARVAAVFGEDEAEGTGARKKTGGAATRRARTTGAGGARRGAAAAAAKKAVSAAQAVAALPVVAPPAPAPAPAVGIANSFAQPLPSPSAEDVKPRFPAQFPAAQPQQQQQQQFPPMPQFAMHPTPHPDQQFFFHFNAPHQPTFLGAAAAADAQLILNQLAAVQQQQQQHEMPTPSPQVMFGFQGVMPSV
ncbi:hypothetical protein HDU96_003389 [Phlyctochytrium bullatum]|nr:hypothetical protein HDU96_003389 [Phlyctochytrium bullatum]